MAEVGPLLPLPLSLWPAQHGPTINCLLICSWDTFMLRHGITRLASRIMPCRHMTWLASMEHRHGDVYKLGFVTLIEQDLPQPMPAPSKHQPQHGVCP